MSQIKEMPSRPLTYALKHQRLTSMGNTAQVVSIGPEGVTMGNNSCLQPLAGRIHIPLYHDWMHTMRKKIRVKKTIFDSKIGCNARVAPEIVIREDKVKVMDHFLNNYSTWATIPHDDDTTNAEWADRGAAVKIAFFKEMEGLHLRAVARTVIS
ncbi:unnamed protein product [Strongylus vulgaris]|uniref:Uncharacterized protein n=1 Tax=Strongylus vulgaris TaxID=40348 RepID=A0A3P7JDI2_STRVU|nr:unnamed protein product [Strongylus vulgaris]